MNRKGVVKLGLFFAIFLSLTAILIFILPAFAALAPGVQGGPSVWINTSTTDANQTDDFFTCNNIVYIRANTSCTDTTVCNESLTATANFSEIGGNQVRAGINVSQQLGVGGYRIFEFNDTVNCSSINITNFQLANITVNASTYDTASTDIGWAAAILVNMSSVPGCPPAGEGIQLPSQVNLLNGSVVNVSECWTNCTVDDVAQYYNSTHYNLCGPTFGSDSVNFTDVAFSGNFSAVPLVLDIPGKVKINFSTPVNMSDQQKSSAIMQFAMKSMMSGGRIGVNESEWNGQGGKPDLNLSASLTIYNFSQRFGLQSGLRPSISRRATYGSGNFLPCPQSICSGITWDGENLTFDVTGFSEYSAEQGLSIVLSNTTGKNFNSSQNISYSDTKNINFSYTPTWNSTVNPQTVTLWGNFTGSWAENVTNSTSLTNASLNYINNTVASDGAYLWNMVINDTTGGNDTHVSNWTIVVDTVSQTLASPTPSNGSYIQGESSQTFSIVVTESGSGVKNGTLYYKKSGDAEYSSTALTSCSGTNPTCTKNLDLSNTGTYPDGTVIQYYFKVYDYADHVAYNGTTTEPSQTTIDRNSPNYTNNNTNTTSIAVGDSVKIYAQWADNHELSYAWLETNETGSWANKTANYSSPVSLSGTSSWSNFSWSNSSVSVGSTIQWRIYANDSAGNENVTATGTFTIDGAAPAWSSNATSVTNNSEYLPGRNYGFQINWIDSIGVSDVVLEWNGTTNYTYLGSQVSKTGNTYYYNLTDLSAATYTVKWYSNDTSNNWNTSDIWNYVVKKNQTNPVDIYIVNSSGTYQNQNVTVIYGASITTNATIVYSSSGTANLYRDNNLVSGATETITLAAKTAGYAYKANVTGNENYTDNSTGVTYYLIINNATLQGSLSGSNVTYPTAVSITPSESNSGDSDVNYTFWRNTTLVSSALGSAPSADTTQLGAGIYSYVLNSTGGANYSSNSSIASLIINVSQNTSTQSYMNLTLGVGTTGSEANLTVEYPNTTNATGWFDSNSFTGSAPIFTLYRNTTSIGTSNPQANVVELGAGVYYYVYNTSGNINYSSASKDFYLTVSKNSSNPVDLYLNNGTAYKNQNVTITYGTTINATAAMVYSGRGSAELYRNETNVTSESGSDVTLAAAVYTYKTNTSGNANYSSNSTGSTYYLTINKATSTCSLTFNVSSPQIYETPVNATCTCTNSEGTTKLYRNVSGVYTDVTSSENKKGIVLPSGTWGYVCNVTQSENYTSAENTSTFTITAAPTSITLYLNGTAWTSSETKIYPNATNVNATINVSALQGSVVLYRNGSTKTNAEEIMLGVSTYNYTGYFAGNENYTTSQDTQILTISKGTPTLTLTSNPSWSPTDVQATTVTCSATSQNSEVIANLYRNGTNVNSTQNGIAQLYAAGVYNYTCNSSATTNYTASSTSQTMTVTGTKGSINGYITDSSSGSGIQGATVYISGYSGVATDTNGYYLITDVTPETYTLTVDKSGYTSNSTSVTVTAGQTTQKNMTMTAGDTTPPNVVLTSPSGTITDNTPTLIVNTSEAGYCKYDTADKSMSNMANEMSGSGTGHQVTLSALTDNYHNFYVRCNDTAGNEMTTGVSIAFDLDTRSLFNITKPDVKHNYFTANKWWSFALPLWTIQTTTLTYYNVTSVLASVDGNYSSFYADIGNNNTWRSYVPGRGVNSFTNFTYNGSASIYYIYVNTTERIEIN